MKILIHLLISMAAISCVSPRSVSFSNEYIYSALFKSMLEPTPIILNSRIEQYYKSFLLWKGSKRNAQWKFEIIATEAWLNEIKIGFRLDKVRTWPKKFPAMWSDFKAEEFKMYVRQFSSYPPTHLYIEKNPKRKDGRIHVFIQKI